MKLSKHTRNDLNLAHICCRSGVFKSIEKELLSLRNKNDWLPIHLAKNKFIFDKYYEDSKSFISDKDIYTNCLKNNAESSQTKYGIDLYNFLIEQSFTEKEATVGSQPPSYLDRLTLSSFYLSNFDLNWMEELDFNPVDIAIKNSNYVFFQAILQTNKKEFFEFFIKNSLSKIGEDFLDKPLAFKVKQILKQSFNHHLNISYGTLNFDLKSNDALKNLEGA